MTINKNSFPNKNKILTHIKSQNIIKERKGGEEQKNLEPQILKHKTIKYLVNYKKYKFHFIRHYIDHQIMNRINKNI